MSVRTLGSLGLVSLLCSCTSPSTEPLGDSGLLNALAQIRAVNLPLASGDPVLQPELGHTVELQHNLSDTMAPRAFSELANGSFRLNAHDFIAHVHPDRLVLNTDTDPEGIEIKMTRWGRGGELMAVGESLLTGERDETYGGVDLVEADRGVLVEWFDGATRGMEHGWTLAARPVGDELLGFELAIDAAAVDVSIDAKRAWIESDEGTTWHVTGLSSWDAEGRDLELWLEPSDAGLMVRVDDIDAVYPVTIDPWYTTTSTEIQSTTIASAESLSAFGELSMIVGSGCMHPSWGDKSWATASSYSGTIFSEDANGYESDLTSDITAEWTRKFI